MSIVKETIFSFDNF